MIVHEDLGEKLLAHAIADLPREAAGVLVGPADERRYDRAIRMRNVADNEHDYAFDPDEQLALWQELEDAGQRVWAVYHSHPRQPAYPSRVDILTAVPDLDYVIIGAGRPVIRAFRIVAGKVTELPISPRA